MDAGAYLQKHGWRGSGNPLGQSGNGIAKPLLVSQKQNLLGVGATTKATQWDTWWSASLDKSLQKLQVANQSTNTITANPYPQDTCAATTLSPSTPERTSTKRLYGGFVKGIGLQGTGVLAKEELESSPEGESGLQEPQELTVSLQKLPKEVKRQRKRREKAAVKAAEELSTLGNSNAIEKRSRKTQLSKGRRKAKRGGQRSSKEVKA